MADAAELIVYVQQILSSSDRIAKNKSLSPYTGQELPYRDIFTSVISAIRQTQLLVLPGLRGTGKSTLLAQVYRYLTVDNGIPASDVLWFSADKNVDLLGAGIFEVIGAYEGILGSPLEAVDRPIYLLIDEIHVDEKWQAAIKDIYERAPRVRIVVTGSSALSLQSRLTADMARRAMVMKIEPLTFSEYAKLGLGVVAPDMHTPLIDALFRSTSAKDAHEKLWRMAPSVMSFMSSCGTGSAERYLWYGSFPFTLKASREESFDKILRTSQEMMRHDIPLAHSFDPSTVGLFPRLMTLLAAWHDVTIEKLRKSLDVKSQITVTQMIDALVDCEVVRKIRPIGSTGVKVNRPARYALAATSVKAAYLWNIGSLQPVPEQYGMFMEDLFIQYFATQEFREKGELFRVEGAGQADFVMQMLDGRKVAVEVGYGPKDGSQVRATMEDVGCAYGVVIADVPMHVENGVLFVPKSFLFAY